MIASPALSPPAAVRLVGRGVMIELLRRKDFYVLVILVGLYALGVLAVSVAGVENAATASFLLNLGLTLAWFASHLLTLLLAGRQMPDEIENRTLYPLLARPLERSWVLLGKWWACTLCGAGTAVGMSLLVWLPVPKIVDLSPTLLVQHLTLQVVSVAMLAALAMAASLIAPKPVTLVALAGLVTFGHSVVSLLTARTHDSLLGPAIRWAGAYVPNFHSLNLVTRYTDGVQAIGFSIWAGLVINGALVTAVALGVAAEIFRRRPL